MRFMILVKADKNSEAGVLPSKELVAAMGKFNEEMALSRPVGERVIYFPGNLLGEVCESRGRNGSTSLRGDGENSGRREGAARMSRRPVVPCGSRPAAEGYSLSSGAPCTSRG
jgi:hypothetical protein